MDSTTLTAELEEKQQELAAVEADIVGAEGEEVSRLVRCVRASRRKSRGSGRAWPMLSAQNSNGASSWQSRPHKPTTPRRSRPLSSTRRSTSTPGARL